MWTGLRFATLLVICDWIFSAARECGAHAGFLFFVILACKQRFGLPLAVSTVWGSADDAKLLELLRTPHDGVDPTELDVKTAKAVHQNCFSQFKHKNSAPLCRGKARSFQVSETLDGHGKRSAAAKKAAEEAKVSSSEEEDSDFESEDEAQEDIDLDTDFFEKEDNEEEEEQFTMPASTRKKRTPRKSSAPAPTRAPSVDDVSASLSSLNLTSSHNMGFSFPCIISTCPDDLDVMCEIELFTQMMPRECFLPDIANQGYSINIHARIPEFFCDEERIMNARGDTDGFGCNHAAEAQAFKNVCEEVANAHDKGVVFGNPQQISLPFQCEERIVEWEIQAYNNHLIEADLEADDGMQHHGVLVTVLQKLRTKRKTKGGFRKVAPVAAPPEEDL